MINFTFKGIRKDGMEKIKIGDERRGEIICLEIPIPKKPPKTKVTINWEEFGIKHV